MKVNTSAYIDGPTNLNSYCTRYEFSDSDSDLRFWIADPDLRFRIVDNI